MRLNLAYPGWRLWCVCVGSGFGFHPTNPGWGVRACVFGCALRLHPASPGCGVRCGCVCLAASFGCASQFLAGVLGCVCARAHSACTPPILAGVLGRVCLGARSACTPPILAGVRCACVWGLVLTCTLPILTRVLGCLSLCACSACTPQILAGVCGVGVCAWVQVSPAPRHSWLGCWGVFFCVHAPPVPRQSWLGFLVRVCGFGFRFSPHQSCLGCWGVCVCVRVALVPRQSWLGCAVWVWVLWFGFRLRPAIPGGVDGVCVLVCALRLYPAIRGPGLWCVCVLPGFDLHPANAGWGVGVCVFVCSLRLYPASPGWGLSCVGWVLPGNPSRAVVCCMLCALTGFAAPGGRCCLAPVHVPLFWLAACLSGVPLWGASWRRVVRRASSRPVALGAPVRFPDAVVPFLTPGACTPRFTGQLRGTCGGRPRTRLMVPAAGPCQGRGTGLAPRCTRSGPRDGVVPGGSLRRRSRAACPAVAWLVRTRSFTRRVSRTVRLSTGASAAAPGLFRVDADTPPFWDGGRHARVLGVCSCACSAWPGWTGWPPGRALVCLTFPLAVLPFYFARPPAGWGCSFLELLFAFFLFFLLLLLRPAVSGFGVWGLILRVLDAFHPRGAPGRAR